MHYVAAFFLLQTKKVLVHGGRGLAQFFGRARFKLRKKVDAENLCLTPSVVLKDLGGIGSAEELDTVLAKAARSKEVIAVVDRLDELRKHTARTIEMGMIGQVAKMNAEIRLRMEEQGVTQQILADLCGWKQSLAAAYLTGAKEPGIANLAKMAAAMGYVWRLERNDKKEA